jgi:hypothetical protein
MSNRAIEKKIGMFSSAAQNMHCGDPPHPLLPKLAFVRVFLHITT